MSKVWLLNAMILVSLVGCTSTIKCGQPFTIIDGMKQLQIENNSSQSTEK